jgi:hypothetical protein
MEDREGFLEFMPVVLCIVLMVFLIHTCCSGCATAPVIPAPTPSAEPWKIIVDGCRPNELPPATHTCTDASLAITYDNLVLLQFGLDECNTWRNGERKVCELDLQAKDWTIYEKDQQLDQWFRKWYITIPLGLAVGVGVGVVIGVVAE